MGPGAGGRGRFAHVRYLSPQGDSGTNAPLSFGEVDPVSVTKKPAKHAVLDSAPSKPPAWGGYSGFTPYVPEAGEDYMGPRQVEHFRQILVAWRGELMDEVERTVHHLQDDAGTFADPNDRATQEEEFAVASIFADLKGQLVDSSRRLEQLRGSL